MRTEDPKEDSITEDLKKTLPQKTLKRILSRKTLKRTLKKTLSLKPLNNSRWLKALKRTLSLITLKRTPKRATICRTLKKTLSIKILKSSSILNNFVLILYYRVSHWSKFSRKKFSLGRPWFYNTVICIILQSSSCISLCHNVIDLLMPYNSH